MSAHLDAVELIRRPAPRVSALEAALAGDERRAGRVFATTAAELDRAIDRHERHLALLDQHIAVESLDSSTVLAHELIIQRVRRGAAVDYNTIRRMSVAELRRDLHVGLDELARRGGRA